MITRPYTRLNGLKTIPFSAVHTRITNTWAYTPRELHIIARCLYFTFQPAHPRMNPLLFFSARGLEKREQDKSYLNVAEVSEVVKRVVQLADDWPDVWGPKDLKQIAVLSAYRFQVHIKIVLQ